MTWLSGWSKRVRLVINPDYIDEDLTDFPVLIYLGSSSGENSKDLTIIFDELGSNSKKIAVTTSDCITQCYVEIERWDSTNEVAWLWVLVPSISSSEVTVLCLYYGKEQADNTTYIGDTGEAPAESVWDNNYVLVAHLNQDPSGIAPQILDSTSNDNDGTSFGGMTSADLVDAIVGKGLDMDGVDDYLNFGTSASLQFPTEITGEIWIRPNTITGWRSLLHKYNDIFNHNQLYLEIHTGGELVNYDTIRTSTGVIAKYRWHHCVYTGKTGGANYERLYVNGSLSIEEASEFNGMVNAFDLITDMSGGGGEEYYGLMDEIRISNIQRSSAWIKATYYTMVDNLVNYSLGWFSEIKEEFKGHLRSCIVEATVTGDWRVDTHTFARNLPFLSVRIGPELWTNVYDRNIGSVGYGALADYAFSIHCFHSNCYEDGEEKGKYAQDLASRIIDCLTTQESPVGADIHDITARESEPSRGAHRISRVIIEGRIHVKRID